MAAFTATAVGGSLVVLAVEWWWYFGSVQRLCFYTVNVLVYLKINEWKGNKLISN